jgi:hypothetical protein
MDRKTLLKLTIFSFLFFQIFSTLVFAQFQSEEWVLAILKALLGTLPDACSGGIDNPDCVSCIGFMKFIPLIFFFAIFFFVFYFIMQQLTPKVAKQMAEGTVFAPTPLTGTHYRIITILGIALAIVFIHSEQVETALSQVLFFMSIAFIFLIVMFVTATSRAIPGGFITVIIGLIIIFGFWLYLWGSFSGIISTWQNMCVGG